MTGLSAAPCSMNEPVVDSNDGVRRLDLFHGILPNTAFVLFSFLEKKKRKKRKRK